MFASGGFNPFLVSSPQDFGVPFPSSNGRSESELAFEDFETQVNSNLLTTIWVWLKIYELGQNAGVGPCFHLPGQAILGTGFLSHGHLKRGAFSTPKSKETTVYKAMFRCIM